MKPPFFGQYGINRYDTEHEREVQHSVRPNKLEHGNSPVENANHESTERRSQVVRYGLAPRRVLGHRHNLKQAES